MKYVRDEGLELNTSEQQAYLSYLISRLDVPKTNHDALLAKAYKEILHCIRNKAANSEDMLAVHEDEISMEIDRFMVKGE